MSNDSQLNRDDSVDPAIRDARRQAKAALSDAPPPQLDGYSIGDLIQRGGQGTVYQAIQKATTRKVAVKVLHGGPFTSPQGRARFEREVAILASLSHPNIVSVIDSGTAAGCPFYVMDYVSGQTLDAWFAGAPRPLENVLQLFTKICNTVNAAHLKGITHRDLKPSNIRIDQAGEPHILDFGLAKVLMGEVTEETNPQMVSESGQVIGSLPWASPEQAEGAPGKVDLRTDVYSLGVILYQMLTGGAFPYEVVGNMRDVIDNIVATEPSRPSLLRPETKGELETIILKSLQKERDRRYQSAGELARDVQRFLDGEPIEAMRDSGLYVLRKTLCKHWAPICAVLLIVATVASVSVLMLRERARVREAMLTKQITDAREQSLLNDAAHAKELADTREQALSDEAALAKSLAQEISAMLRDSLNLATPDVSQGADGSVALRQLERASKQVGVRLERWPAVEADLRDTIGNTYRSLGMFDLAEPELRRSLAIREQLLGPTAGETVDSMNTLGLLCVEQGRFDEAESLLEPLAKSNERVFGPEDVRTITAKSNLGALRVAQGDYAEAEVLLRAVHEHLLVAQPDGEEVLRVANSLGSSLLELARTGGEREQNKGDEALKLFDEVLAGYVRREMPRHPDRIVALNNKGSVHWRRHQYKEATPLFEEALPLARDVFGQMHFQTQNIVCNLGLCYLNQGFMEKARPLLEESLRVDRATLSNTHQQTLLAMMNMLDCYFRMNEFKTAEPLADELSDIVRVGDRLPAPDTVRALNSAGAIYAKSGATGKALDALEHAKEVAAGQLLNEHAYCITTKYWLGLVYANLERHAEARSLELEVFAWAKANEQLGAMKKAASVLAQACAGLRLDTESEAWKDIAEGRRTEPPLSPGQSQDAP